MKKIPDIILLSPDPFGNQQTGIRHPVRLRCIVDWRGPALIFCEGNLHKGEHNGVHPDTQNPKLLKAAARVY